MEPSRDIILCVIRKLGGFLRRCEVVNHVDIRWWRWGQDVLFFVLLFIIDRNHLIHCLPTKSCVEPFSINSFGLSLTGIDLIRSNEEKFSDAFSCTWFE